jgi:2-phosphosulfolactate phosphatase
MRHQNSGRSLVVDVVLAPAELSGEQVIGPGTVAIVVDVIRATTTLAVMGERGCAQVLVAGDIAVARAYAAEHRAEGYLLAGEVGGARPPGFDFGNSPVELAAADLTGRTLVFCTTNGTRALRACAGAGAILAGSLHNAEAISQAALKRALALDEMTGAVVPDGALSKSQPEGQLASREAASEQRLETEGRAPDIVIVCSGRSGRSSLDDTWCAGFLVERLESLEAEQEMVLHLREGAQIAREVSAHTGSAFEVFARSDAGRSISQIGLARDLAVCAASSVSQSVPLVVGSTPEGLLIVEWAW